VTPARLFLTLSGPQQLCENKAGPAEARPLADGLNSKFGTTLSEWGLRERDLPLSCAFHNRFGFGQKIAVQQFSGVEICGPCGFPIEIIIETIKKSGESQLDANTDKSPRWRFGNSVLDHYDPLVPPLPFPLVYGGHFGVESFKPLTPPSLQLYIAPVGHRTTPIGPAGAAHADPSHKAYHDS
jgi:hypothetical protein